MYIVFPVISYIELISRLIMEPNWNASPHLRTLLYALRLGVAAANYRMNSNNESELRALVCQVETSRLSYDFVDPPTLDAVVCSLFLFTACNVLRNHQRAFLYLSEASFLLEAFVPTSEGDEQRRLRLEKVLFNTESASLAIYGGKGLKRRAQRPSNRWESYSLEQNNIESDRVAVHLLGRLTQIHLAEDAQDFENIGVESEVSMKTLFGPKILEANRYARIQSADVVITRQWRLSCQLVTRRISGCAAKELESPAVESLGVVAMSWLRLLKQGDLRIIGLGKLVGLALNISMLGGKTRFQDALYGLTSVVLQEDHEGEFFNALSDLIVPTFSTLSPMYGSERAQTTSNSTQDVWTGIQPTSKAIAWPESLTEIDSTMLNDNTEWMYMDNASNTIDYRRGSMIWNWSPQALHDTNFLNETSL